jgi:pyroglutamyl-peptidase
MRPRLLVTGFGPFPTMPRNPSGGAAIRVATARRWALYGVEARPLVLTTAYSALDTELRPALAEGPAAVLMIGVAGRTRPVRVERRATGRRSTLFPDVAGERGAGPGALRSAAARATRVAPVKPLLALRAQGLPARISRDAGRYLCNASYHQALALAAPVLFIHIPKPPSPTRPARLGALPRRAWNARLDAALTAIGLILMREARNARAR